MPMQAPFQGFSPELLAQIAHGAFRPPQAMGGGAPGLGMQAPQQGGDGGLGAGMAGLGMGLGILGRGRGDIFAAKARTAGDADLGGYGSSSVDPMSGNPNAVPEIFNPTGAVGGAGGGGFAGLMGRLGLPWPSGGLF